MTVQAARDEFPSLAVHAKGYENYPSGGYTSAQKQASEALNALDEARQQLDAMVQYSVKVDGLVKATQRWLDAFTAVSRMMSTMPPEDVVQSINQDAARAIMAEFNEAQEALKLEGSFLVS